MRFNMKKPCVVHPFLFAVFPILSFYFGNIDELLINELYIPAIAVICFTMLLWFLLNLIFKDIKKGGLLTSFLLFCFFSYGHFSDLIRNLPAIGFEIGRHRYFYIVWLAFLVYGSYCIVKTRKDLRNITVVLNIMAAFLIIIPVLNIGKYELINRNINRNKSEPGMEADADLKNSDKYPDIYYIILDRYAGFAALKEYYNYDNGEFFNYLIKRGFYVATESRCNYPSTTRSLVSSLNMKYLDYKAAVSGDKTVLSRKIEDFEVRRFLKTKKYEYMHIGYIWGQKYKEVDTFRCMSIFFQTLLFETTMLKPFNETFFFRKIMRARTLNAFKTFDKVVDIDGPKFVFAHLLLPHPPYVFDRNGEMPANVEINRRSENENYVNQLIFTTKKIEQTVDMILSRSKKLPVIILQADEGPTLSESEDTDKWFLNKKLLKKRTSILNAYYLPNVNNKVLYKSITPVNSFRLIFNLYFNTNYKMLSDKVYIGDSGFDNIKHKYGGNR